MEYGVFLESHFIWFRFLLFLGALAIFVASIMAAVYTYEAYESKREFLEKSRIEEYSGGTILWSIVAAISFLTALVLLIMWFWTGSGNPQECSSEKYVSAGYYNVVESKIVYDWVQLTDSQGRYLLDENGNSIYGTGKPDHFELKLEGRADSKENADLKMVLCITIPYAQVAENHTFLPSMPETKRVDIILPAFAKKQSDGWWQFTEIRIGTDAE